MTKAEYARLYAEASRKFPRITLAAVKEMRAAYVDATKAVAERLKQAILTNKSELTIKSWQNILNQLYKAEKTLAEQIALENAITQKITFHIPEWPAIQGRLSEAAASIREALKTVVPNTVRTGNQVVIAIHEDYLADVLELTGGRITETGIINVFNMVNERLVSSIAGRIYQDGYAYSTRVWNAGLTYQDDIKRIVTAGLAQGRDIIEIAEDLNVFVEKSKASLMKRYGALRRGTRAFSRRIRKNVYYPSLRLVRSELYASLQDLGKYMGQVNPACDGFYDWIRGNNEDWNCSCPEYAKDINNPYYYTDVPDYPHSNCLCSVRPRLRDSREFQDDLIRWANGETVPYLDNWYSTVYLQVA